MIIRITRGGDEVSLGEEPKSAALGVECVLRKSLGREAMRRMKINEITITTCAIAGESDIIRDMKENQIVVYQPNETVRLEVRMENETVWLTQSQICELFDCGKSNVSYHLKTIFSTNELDEAATVQKIRTVRQEGGRRITRDIEYFNLDVIISLGYRINSKRGIQFRQWATSVLKEFMLRGYAVNARFNMFEERFDRRLSKTEKNVSELMEKVDFFVQTKTPPVQGVFFDGQLWEARRV